MIRRGNFVLRENDDLFVPALWNPREIIAYSRRGYPKKGWQLMEDWHNVRKVDLYRITAEGCVPLKKRVRISEGRLGLAMDADEAISIVPAVGKLAGRNF